MSTRTRTYSISLKGEKYTFAVEAWEELSFDAAYKILSDLTGYLGEYLADELPRHFDRLGYASLAPANAHDGDVPVFLLRSSDGGKPDASEYDLNPAREDGTG